ncbi:MAG TPA: glycosyltransferase family 39 protein, partial [Thermoanaerobaculia bacterium]
MRGRPKAPFRVPPAVAWIALIAASLALLAISWGKWSDAIVDSGREWIVPDGLSRGELLYKDVIYWFPPLTPYLHAGLFRLLGSDFRTLALAGCLTAAASIAALSFALRRITGRREAFLWCAIAVPALVFVRWGGGAIIGMGFRIWQAAAFTLCAAALASRGRANLRTAVVAGVLSGLAGLCRTEWGLASLAACGLAIGVRRSWRGTWKPWLAATAAAVGVFGAGVGVFLFAAGPGPVLEDGHVLLTGLPWETRRFLRNASGMHDWSGGALRMIHSAALWVVAWLLIQ